MATEVDQRVNPRLKLSYPIRLFVRREDDADLSLGHTVTQNLSARGAYFHTFHGDAYEVGLSVAVEVAVPHKLTTDAKQITLDLRGEGRVIRVESPTRHVYGESGVTLAGVAVEFVEPLSFHYCWM